MRSEAPTREEFKSECDIIATDIILRNFNNLHIKRAIKLANAKGGGHDQFLTGIIVQFDLTVSNKCWAEVERYHFLDFVSSMSSMHRASVFNFSECCNSFTSDEAIQNAENLRNEYNNISSENKKEKSQAYLRLLYNIPSGFELMAGMTTNYRCLKNIYSQRKQHRLPCWKLVCSWIETLPMSKEFIIENP